MHAPDNFREFVFDVEHRILSVVVLKKLCNRKTVRPRTTDIC